MGAIAVVEVRIAVVIASLTALVTDFPAGVLDVTLIERSAVGSKSAKQFCSPRQNTSFAFARGIVDSTTWQSCLERVPLHRGTSYLSSDAVESQIMD